MFFFKLSIIRDEKIDTQLRVRHKVYYSKSGRLETTPLESIRSLLLQWGGWVGVCEMQRREVGWGVGGGGGERGPGRAWHYHNVCTQLPSLEIRLVMT